VFTTIFHTAFGRSGVEWGIYKIFQKGMQIEWK
jgi:hypothetical protein